MEGMTEANSGHVAVNADNKADLKISGDEREILINSDSHPQRKEGSKDEYEEDTALDGEFIKVEKELEDMKESFHLHKPIEVEEAPSATGPDSSILVTNINLQVQDKVKSLELQLETVSKEMQQSESEKALLKSEVNLANEKLETKNRHCEELELEQKRLRGEILAAEQKYDLQFVSFQEALGALDVKNKEMGDLRESFSRLSSELESSRQKMEDLELALVSSASEARKLEELSSERSSHAESESKRAVDLERMLEVAKQSAQEMEGQMGNLQEELNGLYNKIKGNQQVEEVLTHTMLELSEFQEKLKLSESLGAELEQKLASKEDVIHGLTRELDMHKEYQEQMKEKVLALENLLSSSRDDLQSKHIKLEEVELKLQQEVKTRESAEANLRNQEMQNLSAQEELVKLTREKESLQSAVDDLNSNLSLTKDSYCQLEDKFNVVDQNFSKTVSLLSEAQSYNEELEQRLKSLQELIDESTKVAETASQRNLELEGLLQASKVAEDVVRAQLSENEMRLISTEQQNAQLEKQVEFAELKFGDADREIKALNEKITEFTTILHDVEEERALSNCHFQGYADRINQLESSLNKSNLRNSELVQELHDLAEMRDTHEGRANAAHQRGLELEDLVQKSHSKAEDTVKKVDELELLLEAERHQTQDLEHLLSITEAKYKEMEAESKRHSSRVSELSTELEAFQTKSTSLECVVQAANEKERALTDMLNVITEERKKLEELSNVSSEKVTQAEKLIEVLQSELKSCQEKLETVEEDLKVSCAKENEILCKLKSAEEQVEHQGRAKEQAFSRCLELESLHESLLKDSELKIQEAVGSVTQKDLEVKQLHGKVKSLEEQAAFYQDQAVEATEKVASLKAELEANAINVVALKKTVDELEGKVSENEVKIEQSSSENELLAGTNSQLRSELEAHQCKIGELSELLKSVQEEKESTAKQLESHGKTIAELTDHHSRSLELNSVTESQMKEAEVQLHEALERLTHRDSEARDLSEKLHALEAQLRICEEKLGGTTAVVENQKVELEAALLKTQDLERSVHEAQTKADQFEIENEGLARVNMTQSLQLAQHETKLSELEIALNAAIADKEDTSAQLCSSRKTIEDLMQQVASDEAKLQSQISSVMEDNSMLNKLYQNIKEELQAVVDQKEEQVKQQKEKEMSLNVEVENLKSEIKNMGLAAAEKEATLSSKLEEHANILHERDIINEQLKELQNNLNLAHNTITEQKELNSKTELEREAFMKCSHGEMEAEHQRATLLEKQVEELKQQLQIAEVQHIEKVAQGSKEIELLNADLDDLKHKLSHNIELEKKIVELENKLQTESVRSPEKAKDEVEVRSRDIGFGGSPTKRKDKKRGGEGVQQATETAPVSLTTTEPSGFMAFRFILGVAVVSVIIGIILGKKY